MDTKETNINVVVRVSPRSQKEIRENSAVVISANGARGKELHVKANPSDVSSKTYSFDKVFGPDADQETVYEEVVAPILEEVLMGYNCTIFAYGQTGTGKTHTMEGDLTSGNNADAGIIPRTLYKLFQKLEKDDSEYSVRVSFLEIYNEELRDLLSNDETTAPKLKIFEDMNRRGSNEVQGMEKILVNSAQDVITILQKGSHKRQTAATKMNEFSSRSHCIFTITVHIKETTADGEDLLKVGKLNLVDLAGSENVGRSGAEKGRAKEAGMINQSLLTLGRVINALVEKGLHIPYRESKLTRLLQDSLGGKTKTCIIAAVSPAKINIEESLSTLDYAHRAKNIRNKPEINQRMTKKALIRDFETQIERLKMDLQATRDKNGVYLAAETYKNLMETEQGRKDRIEEMEKTIQAKEDAIKRLSNGLEEHLELLESTQKELSGTKNELTVKTQTLNEALGNVQILEQNLSEQKVLTGAHSATEESLHTLHSGLVSFMQNAVNENYGLHAKIERKSAVEISNMRLFNDFQNGVLREISTLDSAVENFKSVSERFSEEFENKIKVFKESQLQKSQNAKNHTDKLMQAVQQQIAEIMHLKDSSHAASTLSLDRLQSTIASLCSAIQKQQVASQEQWVESSKRVEEALDVQKHLMNKWYSTIESAVGNLSQNVKRVLEDHGHSYQELVEFVKKSMNTEIETLRIQKQSLETQLEAHSAHQSIAQSELISSITQLVQNYATNADSRAKQIYSLAVDNGHVVAEASQRTLDRVNDASARDFCAFEESKLRVEKEMMVMNSENGRQFEASQKNLQQTQANVKSMHEDYQLGQDCVSHAISDGTQSVAEVGRVAYETEIQHNSAIKAALEKYSNILCSDLDSVEKTNAADYNEFEEKTLEVQNMMESHRETTFTFALDAAHTITQARNEIQCKKLTHDEPTGQTPRKRKINVPLDWAKTRSYDSILSEYRQNNQQSPIAFDQIQGPVRISKKLILESVSSPDTATVTSPELESDTGNMMQMEEENGENEAPVAVVANVEKCEATKSVRSGRTLGKIRGNNNAGNGNTKLPMMLRSRNGVKPEDSN